MSLHQLFREHRYGVVLAILIAVLFLAADDYGGSGSGSGSGGGSTKRNDCYSCVYNELKDCVGPSVADEIACSVAAVAGDPLPGAAPAVFEANFGQEDAGYSFVSRQGRTSLLLPGRSGGGGADISLPSGVLRARLVGARDAQPEALNPRVERINYFLGNRPEQWLRDLPTYEKVRYRDVYPGVDVIYYGTGLQLEHDFVVAPGADPAAIKLRFEGARRLRANSDGDLEFTVGTQTVLWKKPALYQKSVTGLRRKVEGRYRMDPGGEVGFETGVYNVNLPLVIDPPIAFSTYQGRAGGDSAARVAMDAAGNSYFTGATNDGNFAFSPGAVAGNTNTAAPGDVIVTKLAADGKTVLYTTHLGGVGTDIGAGIAVDAAGNIIVAGGTTGFDFPVTKQVQTPAPAANQGHCFVLKLNNAGNSLLFSTLLGGSASDLCSGVALDAAGNIYVTGATVSKDFPVRNGFQQVPRIGATPSTMLDGFVTKLAPDGASILYSTFFGGNSNDAGIAIAVDAAGNAYVTGGTISENFPITAGAFQTVFAGRGAQNSSFVSTGDAFVLKVSPTGDRIYSTLLGGSKDDVGIGLAIDAQGNAYVGGSTSSPNFPVMQAFQTTYEGSGGEPNYFAGDGFIAKLNPTGTALLYSSYMGGKNDDRVSAVAVDASGNAFIAGNTLSLNFPLSADAPQKIAAGQSNAYFRTGDAFFAQIGPSGTLVYSSFLGGKGSDFATGVALDGQGGIVVAGGTDSIDFPTTATSAQSKFGGADGAFIPAGDAFLVRYGTLPSVSISAVQNAASYASAAIAPGEIVVVRGVSIGPADLAKLQLNANGTVATTVAATRILFDDVPAPIVYVSAAQSAVIVPYAVAGRASTNVVVEYNGNRSAPVSVPVTAAVPGLFSADSSGSGPAALLNQDNSYNSAQNPALKGSIVQLYGTGEGQTNPAGVEGRLNNAVFPKPVLPVAVMIGGTRIETLAYYGAAPSSVAGLLQINVSIPLNTPSGNVPVQLIVGTATSPQGLTIAIR